MEDMPFFEAPSGSLTRASSIKRKKLRKQESLKNMTEFQLRFEVAEVKLHFFLSLQSTPDLSVTLFCSLCSQIHACRIIDFPFLTQTVPECSRGCFCFQVAVVLLHLHLH